MPCCCGRNWVGKSPTQMNNIFEYSDYLLPCMKLRSASMRIVENQFQEHMESKSVHFKILKDKVRKTYLKWVILNRSK